MILCNKGKYCGIAVELEGNMFLGNLQLRLVLYANCKFTTEGLISWAITLVARKHKFRINTAKNGHMLNKKDQSRLDDRVKSSNRQQKGFSSIPTQSDSFNLNCGDKVSFMVKKSKFRKYQIAKIIKKWICRNVGLSVIC